MADSFLTGSPFHRSLSDAYIESCEVIDIGNLIKVNNLFLLWSFSSTHKIKDLFTEPSSPKIKIFNYQYFFTHLFLFFLKYFRTNPRHCYLTPIWWTGRHTPLKNMDIFLNDLNATITLKVNNSSGSWLIFNAPWVSPSNQAITRKPNCEN